MNSGYRHQKNRNPHDISVITTPVKKATSILTDCTTSISTQQRITECSKGYLHSFSARLQWLLYELHCKLRVVSYYRWSTSIFQSSKIMLWLCFQVYKWPASLSIVFRFYVNSGKVRLAVKYLVTIGNWCFKSWFVNSFCEPLEMFPIDHASQVNSAEEVLCTSFS